MARYGIVFTLALLTVSSCKTMPRQGPVVRVTHYLEDVAGCRYLGEVATFPPFAGPRDGENAIREKTAQLGGDVVYYAKKQVGTLVGRSFDCDGRYARRF